MDEELAEHIIAAMATKEFDCQVLFGRDATEQELLDARQEVIEKGFYPPLRAVKEFRRKLLEN
jgi:hypothetical protein